MSEEKELEQFKQEFTQRYIDPYLDRLLDLRNNIRNATNFEEIKSLMEKEQRVLCDIFGEANLPARREDGEKKEEDSNTN